MKMELGTVWFILIAILYTGYFILEGFDFGVGILLPFLAHDDNERRAVINTIGPHWDANEVWLITAGGATFAAFPNWYATLFSGFYLPLFLILIALIFRGVAFEFRSKDENPRWRSFWDGAIFAGSLIPALLWGVAFANILQGVPIDQNMIYTGGFFNLLNPYALVGGLVSLIGFALAGAIFLSLKTVDPIHGRARRIAGSLWLPEIFILAVFVALSVFGGKSGELGNTLPLIIGILALAALVISLLVFRKGREGWSFGLAVAANALTTVSIFVMLFPRVMVSSLDPKWNLTIANSASSPYTLKVMTIVAAIFVPIVLLYQAWTYWIFRKRVTMEPEKLEY
jgi:cytochrome d ubiquinol oxidase subunit II